MGNLFKSKFYHEYLSLFSTTFKTIYRNRKNTKLEPEVSILNKFVSPGNVCVDIGGAYGRYALPLSRLVGKTGMIYSFEPGYYSYKVISFILKFSGLKNVVIIKKALSNCSGQIKLISPIKRSGKVGASLSYISESENKDAVCELVPMTTLDSFCSENDIKEVSFIKCDTEGSEFLIYQGAGKIIADQKPTILSEVDTNNLNRYHHTVKDLEEFFFKKNYRIFVLEAGTLKEIKHITANGNYFFVHESKCKNIV